MVRKFVSSTKVEALLELATDVGTLYVGLGETSLPIALVKEPILIPYLLVSSSAPANSSGNWIRYSL